MNIFSDERFNQTAESDAWNRYNAVTRILTPAFIRSIPWESLGPCPSKNFAKALMIASDIETATYDVFFIQELSATPSGRDPIISAFMKRWVQEELTHGELLRKLLLTWGYRHEYVPPRLSLQTRMANRMIRLLGRCFGGAFKAIHMIWGAINELTARETYRQLRESTADPVLRLVLGAIIKEESLHANFYVTMARAKTSNWMTRTLCRTLIRTWKPVGGWNKSIDEMLPVFGLFAGDRFWSFDRNVTREFERRLPAFAGSGLTERFATILQAAGVEKSRRGQLRKSKWLELSHLHFLPF